MVMSKNGSPSNQAAAHIRAPRPRPDRSVWYLRGAFLTILAMAIVTVLVTNQWLTERFTESTKSRAELRLALYSGNLLSELQRNSIVPQILARDPTLM